MTPGRASRPAELPAIPEPRWLMDGDRRVVVLLREPAKRGAAAPWFRLRRPRETLNDFEQLMVRNATRVAKLLDLMFVCEPVQAEQLTGALAPPQLAARMADKRTEAAAFRSGPRAG